MALSTEEKIVRERDKLLKKYETELRRIESTKAAQLRMMNDIGYQFPKDYQIHHVKERWLRNELERL